MGRRFGPPKNFGWRPLREDRVSMLTYLLLIGNGYYRVTKPTFFSVRLRIKMWVELEHDTSAHFFIRESVVLLKFI